MKKMVLYLVILVILGVFMSLGMACTTTVPPFGWDDEHTGEETPLLEWTVWNYSWEMVDEKARIDWYSQHGAPIRGSYKIEFHPGGFFVYPDYLETRDDSRQTWERIENNVRMLVTSIRHYTRTHYEGIYDQANQRIIGSYVQSRWAGAATSDAVWVDGDHGIFTTLVR